MFESKKPPHEIVKGHHEYVNGEYVSKPYEHQAFPRWMHPEDPADESILVSNEAERQEALEAGYADMPKEASVPAAEVVANLSPVQKAKADKAAKAKAAKEAKKK